MTEDRRQPATWDEILSQPITSVKDEGWRAVRPIEAISPRPQEPPASLPPPDSFVIVPRAPQPEEPATSPLPPTLADQLSLTWATKRVRQKRDEAGEEADAVTSRTPAQPPATPIWRRPIEALSRAFRRKEERPDVEVPTDRAPTAPETQPVSKGGAKPARAENQGQPPETEPAALGDSSLPLTLARENPAGARAEALAAAPPASPSTPEIDAAPRPPAPPADRAPGPVSAALRVPAAVLRTPARVLSAARDLATRPGPPTLRGSPAAAGGGQARVPEPGPLMPATAPAHSEMSVALPPSPASTPGAPARQPDGPHLTLSEARRPPSRTQPASEKTADASPPAPSSGLPSLTHRVLPPALEAPDSPSSAGKPSAPPDDGQVLSPVLRERMEGLLDVPLRDVRIFRGVASETLTRRLKADAVTVDQDVHVAAGKGDPVLASGQALLAHELSHVAATARPSAPAAEESRALRLEHAVQRRDTAGSPREASATPSFATAPDAFASAGSYPSSGSAASGPSGGRTIVARAAVDREVATAEPPPATPAALTAAGAAGPAATNRRDEDVAGLVERVVEAVMRRLKRDSALERERRGAFRSQIGG